MCDLYALVLDAKRELVSNTEKSIREYATKGYTSCVLIFPTRVLVNELEEFMQIFRSRGICCSSETDLHTETVDITFSWDCAKEPTKVLEEKTDEKHAHSTQVVEKKDTEFQFSMDDSEGLVWQDGVIVAYKTPSGKKVKLTAEQEEFCLKNGHPMSTFRRRALDGLVSDGYSSGYIIECNRVTGFRDSDGDFNYLTDEQMEFLDHNDIQYME